MLNQVVLVGNLGAAPETYFSPEGTAVTSFSLAFNSSPKKTCWIRVTGFGRISEICEKYLDQGDRVGVAGSLSQDKWESETGEKRSSYKIIAHSIEFIKVKKKVEDGKGEDDIPF